MLIVRKIFRKNKSSGATEVNAVVQGDWVADAIAALNVVAEVGKMVPVASGFIEGGATILRLGLERLKVCQFRSCRQI